MYTPDGTKQGGKREIDVELNLVPFIDLMSTCICFLLITAVWTQVSMIQIGSSIYGKKTSTGQVEQPTREQVNLKIDISRQGYTVRIGKQSLKIPKVADQFDQAALMNELKNIKARYPEKSDGIISLTDEIKYDELIKGMDSLMLSGFPEIAIATQGIN
ncbi:MAG: biopolymer transporter ExbD [Oligoflexia bacterium]|nr:biopolymer transporter ExbD [Oligoflexia bacterium]